MDYKITEDDQLGVAYIDLSPNRTKGNGVVGQTIVVDVEELMLRFTMLDIEVDHQGRILGIKLY